MRGDSGELISSRCSDPGRLWPRLAVGNENRLQSTSTLRWAPSGPYGLIGQQHTTSGKLPRPLAKGSLNDTYLRINNTNPSSFLDTVMGAPPRVSAAELSPVFSLSGSPPHFPPPFLRCSSYHNTIFARLGMFSFGLKQIRNRPSLHKFFFTKVSYLRHAVSPETHASPASTENSSILGVDRPYRLFCISHARLGIQST